MTIQDLAATAARERADAIRSGIDSIAAALDKIPPLIIEAHDADDWKTLGYDSWAAYVEGEYGTSFIKLQKAQRKEWTATLTDAGLTQREIAAVTNVSQMQVSRDSAETKVSDEKKAKRKLPEIRINNVRVEGGDLISARLLYDEKSHHLKCPHCEGDV
jgi:hypothetical protein